MAVDIEHPRWEEYEQRFRALAETVDLFKGPNPALASAKTLLFLYGDNALTPEQEFEVLARLEQNPCQLRGLEVTTSYWEDLALYLEAD